MNHLQKLFLIVIFCLLAVLSGCETAPQEEEPFDESRLTVIDDYVIEMSEELIDLLPDLEGWVRVPYSDNLPLVYSEERIELLTEHRLRIEELQKIRTGPDFPTYEEITGWEVIVIRSGREWLFDGYEVAASLKEFNVLVSEAFYLIEQIERGEGELDMADSKRVLMVLEEVEPAVEEIRYILFRLERPGKLK